MPLTRVGWLIVPAVLVIVISMLNLVLAQGYFAPAEDYGIIGGPEALSPVFSNINEAAVLNQSFPEVGQEGFFSDDVVGFLVASQVSFANVGSPIFNSIPTREGIVTYKVQDGDNLSQIAANFGISLNTMYWANGLSSSVIQPGDELTILPVSGVRHIVEDGDTISSIAEKYSADQDKIREFNNVAGVLQPGQTLIIPGGKGDRAYYSPSPASLLPNYSGYYKMPTTGWNWGRLHADNAVDIANSCGTEIYAAANGLVVEVGDSGWNYGYGKYVKIEHANNTETFYAHTQKNAVSVGELVNQGDLIAYIGNTGKTHGPTGCHVHLEVRGAKNPFAK